MYWKLVLQVFSFCIVYILPVSSIDWFNLKEQYNITILNHEMSAEKIHLKLFRKEGRVLTSTVKLNEISAKGQAKCKSLSQVIHLEAWCKKNQKDCSRLLESDINVIALTGGSNYNFMDIQYYCKHEKTKDGGYYFSHCFETLSSKELSKKEEDAFVHIVYIFSPYNNVLSFKIRLVKTDNSVIEILHDGSKNRKIFDAKGSPSYVREIIVDAGLEESTNILIFVSIEGRNQFSYRLKRTENDEFRRYEPTESTKVHFRTDGDLTGLEPHKNLQPVLDACSSRREMGTLLVDIHQDNIETIELRLDLKNLCNQHNPSLAMKFPSLSPVVFVEATCDNSQLCQQLLEDDLHVMKIFYAQGIMGKNYFCKHQILPSNKYLYKLCQTELSETAIKQKKGGDFAHLVFLSPDYPFKRLGKLIKVIQLDKTEHTIGRKGRDKRVYQFISSASPVDYVLLQLDIYDAVRTRVGVLTEGNEITRYCLDQEERKIKNWWKFTLCESERY